MERKNTLQSKSKERTYYSSIEIFYDPMPIYNFPRRKTIIHFINDNLRNISLISPFHSLITFVEFVLIIRIIFTNPHESLHFSNIFWNWVEKYVKINFTRGSTFNPTLYDPTSAPSRSFLPTYIRILTIFLSKPIDRSIDRKRQIPRFPPNDSSTFESNKAAHGS